MKSLQARLSVGLLSVLVIGGLIFAQVGLWLFESGIERYLESNLRSQSETLLLALVRTPEGVKLADERLLPAYQRAFSGYYFQIDLGDHQLRSRSLWDAQLPQPGSPGLSRMAAPGPDGQQVIVLRTDYRRLGTTLSITVAQDYTPIRDSFARLRQWGLAVGALLLVALLGLQRMIVTRALRPLEAARAQLAQLQQGQRAQLQLAVPSELEPLITQINHLHAHTEDSLKKARTALGNLGHALKTPLAVLFSQANSVRLEADPALRATLLEQLGQVQSRLDKELARARLAGDALPGTPFDCAAELPSLFATLRAIHGEHLQLGWTCPPTLVLPWDREDMLELLGNLLDNAGKWADSQARLTIKESLAGYRLRIEDDGPGIPADAREQVLARGERLDERTRGHGLGLGIVRDITDACHGRLTLLESPLGGLQVDVELPRRKLSSTSTELGR
ncbi:sensor histidine kinase [Pseudomonas sp. RIT-PI-S]|uniref:ATP-binding protein n=1 Tax=Pseudomonas sp. RIT-PI-S TaxID=3035295 RepID=UPI0021D9DA85|nr:sensor histidine kinase [Pseudomonas sp. RIT-PI-S]